MCDVAGGTAAICAKLLEFVRADGGCERAGIDLAPLTKVAGAAPPPAPPPADVGRVVPAPQSPQQASVTEPGFGWAMDAGRPYKY